MANNFWNKILVKLGLKKATATQDQITDAVTADQSNISVTLNEVAVKKKSTSKPKSTPKMKASKETKTKKTAKKK
jgi:hypothetical protein